MKILKTLLKYTAFLLLSIVLYILFALLLSFITVNENTETTQKDVETIYLHSNGVHLSVILPIKSMSEKLKNNLVLPNNHRYAKFGWGNENFYLNVPTWSDFKFKYAFEAFFLNTPTAIHVTTNKSTRKNWVAVKVNAEELMKMNSYLENSFKVNTKGNKEIIPQNLYTNYDTFYKAIGSYSPAKTCNTWVNSGFKESGLKASFWTLFDFGLLNKYEND